MIAGILALVALAGSGQQEAGRTTGQIASRLVAPASAVWIDPDPTHAVSCRVIDPARWECTGVPQGVQGLVVVVGDGGVSYQAVGTATPEGAKAHRWGRVMQITQGGVASEDLANVQVTAWKPERSSHLLRVSRLYPAKDSAVDIVRLGREMFWISGDTTDPDAYVRLDGPSIGSVRVAVSMLADGTPDAPAYVAVAAPSSLTGRVQSSRGDDVEGAEVELFEPVSPPGPESRARFESLPMLRQALTRTDRDGAFVFEHLSSGPFLVAVTDAVAGRATAIVDSVAATLVIRLRPTRRATGRVLKDRAPVAGARVRHIPAVDAFGSSANPRELLAAETTTGSDGRFSLPLPPVETGTIQIIGADGTSVRVPLGAQGVGASVDLGDIVLSAPRRLTVRVLDPARCELSAIGPVGSLGLTDVRAAAAGSVHWFELPEAGEWLLSADCEGKSYDVDPMTIVVSDRGAEPTLDVRIVR